MAVGSSANKDPLYNIAASFEDKVEEDFPGVESTEGEHFDFIVNFLDK